CRAPARRAGVGLPRTRLRSMPGCGRRGRRPCPSATTTRPCRQAWAQRYRRRRRRRRLGATALQRRAETGRNRSTTKNAATATAAIVADAAVSAYQETRRPTTTEATPRTAPAAIIAGTRRTRREAVAGGATSRPNTNRLPTVRKEATTARVISASMTTCAALG